MKWMATRPGQQGGHHAHHQGHHRCADGRPRRPAACAPRTARRPVVIGVAIRNAKRAADSRSMPTIRAAEIEIPDRLMPGTRASAWATPMPTAMGKVTSETRARARPEPVGEQQDQPADDERDGDEPDLAERCLDEIAEDQPGDRRGDRGRHQQPGEAPVVLPGERAFAHGCDARRDQAQPVGAKVGEERNERAEMEHDAERQRVQERVIPAREVRDEDEVPRGGHGQELGQALHDPHDQGLKDRIHRLGAPILGSRSGLPDEQRGQHEGDRGEQLHEDVERRAGGVLERVADRVADDGRGVGVRALAEDGPVRRPSGCRTRCTSWRYPTRRRRC